MTGLLAYAVSQKQFILSLVVLSSIWFWFGARQYIDLQSSFTAGLPTLTNDNLPVASPDTGNALNAPIIDPVVDDASTAKDAPAKIDDAFDVPPVDSQAFKDLCTNTEWNPELVFTCDKSVGGIGNIRNSILHCVRYAIAAGAGLQMPRIIVRDTQDISAIRTDKLAELDYLFDVEHFLASFKTSCPELKLFVNRDELAAYKHAGTVFPESLITKNGEQAESWQITMDRPEDWRKEFYAWLSKQDTGSEETGSDRERLVVNLERSYLQYPIHSDKDDFADAFGGILKFRKDTRVLATKVLHRLESEYSLDLSLNTTAPAPAGSFFGVHLRTERDAGVWQFWSWGHYEKQASAYLEQVAASRTPIVFIASGDTEQIARFRADAAALPMRYPMEFTVVSKSDLLLGEDLKELNSLVFDQQGLVDFMVMLKAADFAGVGHSSFTWNIALRRHLFSHKKNPYYGQALLSDEYSMIYGDDNSFNAEYNKTMWP